jgi:hypothetical protein
MSPWFHFVEKLQGELNAICAICTSEHGRRAVSSKEYRKRPRKKPKVNDEDPKPQEGFVCGLSSVGQPVRRLQMLCSGE